MKPFRKRRPNVTPTQALDRLNAIAKAARAGTDKHGRTRRQRVREYVSAIVIAVYVGHAFYGAITGRLSSTEFLAAIVKALAFL